jgi:hypothetical protein
MTGAIFLPARCLALSECCSAISVRRGVWL